MLSILIVNWNTRELLRACLTSIAAHPPSDPYEVIVVDNASTDGSAQMVQESFPWVRLIASRENTGYARGNNLAFAEAKGDWLLTLNPDTEFTDNSLDVALQVLREHPEAGALGVKQIGVDGRVQKSVRGFPTVRGILGDLAGIKAWDSYRLASFDYEREQLAPQPMGTFLLFRREALRSMGFQPMRIQGHPAPETPESHDLGGRDTHGLEAHATLQPYDEGFPIFFNEVDLLYRLDQAGWKTIYTPRASILHHGGESTKQVRKSMIWESHKSLLRYFRKHYGTGLAKLGLPLLAAVVYAAAFVRAKGYHAGFRA